jgi:hypothetical protein
VPASAPQARTPEQAVEQPAQLPEPVVTKPALLAADPRQHVEHVLRGRGDDHFASVLEDIAARV